MNMLDKEDEILTNFKEYNLDSAATKPVTKHQTNGKHSISNVHGETHPFLIIRARVHYNLKLKEDIRLHT